MDANTKLQILAGISQNVVYMLGGAFVAGSAVTLLILLMLDYLRRHDHKK